MDSQSSVSIKGDRDLLFQALANLLDNAIKYSPPSSVIYAKLDNGEFTLCDSGPGIDESDHDKVFQYLETALVERSGWLSYLRTDPIWKSVRDDGRMRAILAAMKPANSSVGD